MSRFDELVELADAYQGLVTENYDRIRRLAEDLRAGLCDWMNARDGVCVRLVPPFGPFEPRVYADEFLSLPPRGFRPLGPIAFGLAIRVSRQNDWMRLTLSARKAGELFHVAIADGPEHSFALPLRPGDPEPFFAMIHDHLRDWFSGAIQVYRQGEEDVRRIGFDFATPETGALTPV